jgi:hypothetical protein
MSDKAMERSESIVEPLNLKSDKDRSGAADTR